MPPSWSPHPERWERAIELWWRGPPAEPDRFIHRDYHPTNVLWQGRKLSGVVDWGQCLLGSSRGRSEPLPRQPAGDVRPRQRRPLPRRLPRAVARTRVPPLLGPRDRSRRAADPEIYPPWQEFGLEGLTIPLFRERAETLLERTWRCGNAAFRRRPQLLRRVMATEVELPRCHRPGPGMWRSGSGADRVSSKAGPCQAPN